MRKLCRQGHPLDGDNVRTQANGRRRCRICQNEATRRSRANIRKMTMDEMLELVGRPMELGSFAKTAQPGDRFLDPQGNVFSLRGINTALDGVDIVMYDRRHKRTRVDGNGNVTNAYAEQHDTWSPRVLVRAIPDHFEVQSVPRSLLSTEGDY